MMKLLLAGTLVVALLLPAAAATIKFDKSVNPGKLRRELELASFQVENLKCDGSACILILAPGEKKDPTPIISAHVFTDPVAERKALLVELATLEAKLDDGTADLTEMRRTLKLVIKLAGLSSR